MYFNSARWIVAKRYKESLLASYISTWFILLLSIFLHRLLICLHGLCNSFSNNPHNPLPLSPHSATLRVITSSSAGVKRPCFNLLATTASHLVWHTRVVRFSALDTICQLIVTLPELRAEAVVCWHLGIKSCRRSTYSKKEAQTILRN